MKNQQKNKQPMNAPIQDAGNVSASSNGSGKASRQDIERVKNMIERFLMLYMDIDEVVKTLMTKARIHPEFTSIVWQRLEEENKDFFKAYYIGLALKRQITVLNKLLEHQYYLMKNFPVPPKIPVAPIPKGVHPKAPEMRYPVQKHPQMHVPGHPHIVKGVPAPATPQVIPPNSSGGLAEMAVSPASMVDSDVGGGGGAGTSRDSVDQFDYKLSLSDLSIEHLSDFGSPYLPSDSQLQEDIDMVNYTSSSDDATTPQVIPPSSTGGMSVASDMVMVDSDVGGGEGGAGNSRHSLSSLDQFDWNLSPSHLTLPNVEDFGSPYLPSDSQLQEDMDKFLGDVPSGSDMSLDIDKLLVGVPSGSDMSLDIDKLLVDVPEPSDEDKP